MANSDAPKGLFPVQHLDGSAFTGKVTMYALLASATGAIFIGDPVKSAGTAGAAGVTINGIDVEGMATVAAAAAGDAIRGVVVGFLPNQSDLTQRYRPSSQARIALVADGSDVVFEVQEDSEGGALAVTNVGACVDFSNIASGSTTTGLSAVELDSSIVESTTTSAQFRILGLAKRPDNVVGTNAKWLVMINEHELKGTTGV